MQTSHIVYRRSAKQNALPSTQKQCVVFPACWASSHIRGHRATLDPSLIYGATQTSRILIRHSCMDYRVRRRKSELESTGYMEIGPGKYSGELWRDGFL